MPGPGMQQIQGIGLQQVLAPQLQQSLQILQAPTLELKNIVQQELQTNPVLEEDPSLHETEDRSSDEADFQEEFEKLAKLDEEWRDYMAQNVSYSARSQEDEERRQFFLDSLANQETLQQHLLDQLNTADIDAKKRKAAELLIGNIDDIGFLSAPLDEMANLSGTPIEDLQSALELVQTFHPVGVGARDLKDCLLIQLRRLGKAQSPEYQIVDQYLDDLGRKRYPDIARRLGVTVDQVQKAANFIATLDPKPGQIFSPEPNSYVLPDVVVEKVGDEYVVSLTGDQIPHLRINKTYRDLMTQSRNGGEVRDYIREKIRSGKFLIKSIHQRQQTILNIAIEIVKRQCDFLDHGTAFLKPMTMVQIADAVGVHETTVSRAISGKYIATPQGVVEMKFFFTPGYQTNDGVALSNTSVKETIADLVRNENNRMPLSDKEIVEILSERGIPIARRTVAKYRAELNILPSNLRKQF
ncbi:MAG: RNA polymerase factor sigma-54 [Verrucomicrobia bacterium]|nr:RNA polymerase factor sigma-54 [Verrucomicrobiota bacterium]MBV8483819.1 RNA polymerase factor sigma-54 [Verrucomicrobiota bacterium]